MTENKKQKQKKQIFYAGILLFALGIALPLLGYLIPSPIESPTYQTGGNTYFFPFLNWLTIGGIAVSAVALAVSKRSNRNE